MSKRNWVCFDCRSVVRREDYQGQVVVCATCSEPRVNLGYKIRIPAKSRVKDWERLRAQYSAAVRTAERQQRETRQREKHALEQEIARLESRPTNPGRAKAVALLRRALQRLG